MPGTTILQVLLAVAIVIILFVVGFMVYGADQVRAIREAGKTKKSTPIFRGIKDLKNISPETYNTLNADPLDPTYLDIGHAINQPSGAEFTYNFWLFTDLSGASSISKTINVNTSNGVKTDGGLDTDNIILFMRGDTTVATYNSLCNTVQKNDIKVKCPLVKLENNGSGSGIGDVLTVEFNTVTSPDVMVENARNTCEDKLSDWNYMNSYKLGVAGLSSKESLRQKWNMVTIVIQDTFPDDPLPIRNKARCRIYINGGLELDKYVDGSFSAPRGEKSTLKENQGNFYIFPNVTIPVTPAATHDVAKKTVDNTKLAARQLMMADMTYYNYALSTTDINALFAADFTKAYAPTPGSTKAKELDNSWMKNLSFDTSANKTTPLA